MLSVTLLAQAQQPESESPATAGRQVFAANCAFCHGASARGGAQGGPNLTQSALVRGDRDGHQLGAFLEVGRPDKGMPAFHFSGEKVAQIAAFLHATIDLSGRRRDFGAEVLVGDAGAGNQFFFGEGHCSRCHSLSGDLKGIGGKYPPAVLQGRMILPIGRGGYPGLSEPESLPERSKPRVTIRQSDGRSFAGILLYLSDYAVTFQDANGDRQTVERRGTVPEIAVVDPLQAHLDLQSKVTDRQMHDLTAFLAGQK